MEKTENLQESVFLGQTITKDKKLRFYQFIDEFVKNAMKNENVEDWDLNGTNVEIAQCFSWLWVVDGSIPFSNNLGLLLSGQ